MAGAYLKYRGKRPLKSDPTGTAFEAKFVATTASDWIKHARNIAVLAPAEKLWSSIAIY